MSKSIWLLCAAIVTTAFGCAEQTTTTDPASASADEQLAIDRSGKPGHSPAACGQPARTPGQILWQRQIVGGNHVIADAQGNTIYTTDPGIVKLDAAGNRVFAFPFGDVVATDADGNIYVAGVFTTRIDLGTGVMYPTNNNDVFLAKLSPSGKHIFAKQSLCSADVLPGVNMLLSIAVAADGRIALSGMTIGTVVLDDTGRLIYQRNFPGQVAFDSTGNLVLGFRFGGDGFQQLAPGVYIQGGASYASTAIVKYDRAGTYLSHFVLERAAIASLALDAADNISFTAEFVETMTLFGQTLTVPVSLPYPAGVQFGAVAVRLDASYNLIWAQQLNSFNGSIRTASMLSGMGGMALNQYGDLIVSSNEPVLNREPYAIPTLAQYAAPTGATLLSVGARANGFGLGVAVDACANIFYASVQYTPSATRLLEKIAAQR